MNTTSPPLQSAWISKIFTHMQGHYGTRWIHLWKTGETLPDGSDAGIVNAMETWAKKLGGFHDQPERFRSVLENLPAQPPSLPEFVAMLRAVVINAPTLKLVHRQTPEETARNKARLREMIERLTKGMVDG